MHSFCSTCDSEYSSWLILSTVEGDNNLSGLHTHIQSNNASPFWTPCFAAARSIHEEGYVLGLGTSEGVHLLASAIEKQSRRKQRRSMLLRGRGIATKWWNFCEVKCFMRTARRTQARSACVSSCWCGRWCGHVSLWHCNVCFVWVLTVDYVVVCEQGTALVVRMVKMMWTQVQHMRLNGDLLTRILLPLYHMNFSAGHMC